MTPADVAALLRRAPAFASVPPPTLALLAAGSRVASFAKGEAIMVEGEPVRGFFLVLGGGVRIFRVGPDGKEQLLQRLRPGQSFAEAAVLTMKRYPAGAEATETPTEVLEIGGEAFLRLFEEDRALARAMVASLSTWLVRLVGRVEDLTVMSAGARLARYLLDLPAREEGRRLSVDLPIPKKELAAFLGITPETLSRLLRKWKDRGLLEADGSRTLVLRDADTLLAIASDPSPAAGL